MSSLIGRSGERWPLSRAVDALGEAAGRAGTPGWLWLAGFFYPSIVLGLGAGWEDLGRMVPFAPRTGSGLIVGGVQMDLLAPGSMLALITARFLALLAGAVLLFPVTLAVFRIVIGLARLAPPRSWDAACGEGRGIPRLREAWRAGRGLTLSAFGLWVQVALMSLLAATVLLGPLVLLFEGLGLPGNPLSILLAVLYAGPALAVLALYATVLSVLMQLALHSLAQNRRGSASAFVHAWRLARNDPWATTRAIAVDLLLYGVLIAFDLAVGWTGLLNGPGALGVAVTLLGAALHGYVGVTRAAYWSLAYRELGGLSADDGVPGLGERVPTTAAAGASRVAEREG